MRTRVLSILLLTIMIVGSLGALPALPLVGQSNWNTSGAVNGSDEIPEELMPMVQQALAEDNPFLPDDYDMGLVLGDRENDFSVMYEPWRSKAAIHAIAYDRGTGFLALGGGYLYDNEVHVFRLNTETNEFDKVWDTGDSLFQSDVLSLDFGDTDLNDFIEIVAGCADGHVYVFEQRHIYDPYANTENQFDHVWTSPDMFRAFAVKVDDIDKDYRPDIIAGGWDGQVHIYEYSKHSGYPFVEAHWITYDEVATLDIGDKVYSIETGDTNANGLPEVVIGTRSGTVYVYENAGITLWINGFPFPLINDNHYYLNWTSQNYTWTPIVSMAVGELDGSLGDELAIVAQGQGVFTLEWDPARKTYDYEKVYKAFEPWETFGLWGLDYYVDSVTEAWNVTYHDPINASINVPEPIEYVWGGSYFIPDASVYPYNTGMAGAPDGNFSTFDASSPSVDNATAILDFGRDEEGTGSANSNPDVWIKFPGLFISGADVSPYFNFSVSRDGGDFEQITPDHFTYSGYYLKIDVDDALSRRKWDYFRYAKISVFNGATFNINSVELQQVYNLVRDALAVTIGPLKEDGNKWYAGTPELDKVVVGTVIGELVGIKYNSSTQVYDLFWESGNDDYYTYGANIWDIEYIGTPTNLPNWNLYTAGAFTPSSGNVANQWGYGIADWLGNKTWNAYLAENLPGGGSPIIRAFDSNFNFDPLTQTLLTNVNTRIQTSIFSFSSVSAELALLPNSLYGNNYLPFMVVGGINDAIPIDSISSVYRANVLFFYRSTNTDPWTSYKELWQLDQDGQLSGLVNLAKTTPRLSFGDYDSDGDLDFAVSNGHLYMAKNIIDITGMLNFTLDPGYFDDINNLQTSAVWGQPDLHDLDGDGDLDLVVSYANKDGATAFINEGTPDDPVWVEQKKLMSNPGVLTNLKLLNITNVRIMPDYGSFYGGPFLERYFEITGLEKPEYYMYGYDEYSNSIWMSTAEKNAADAYVIATYPTVARLQLNLMSGDPAKFYNLGFHIIEDWNTNFDLDNWTLSITNADTDNDGQREIIVGDYDNNVYAFEHLVNNTYKRMFKSFDLNHTEKADVSPYAYQDLEGISGEFNRRIWDHAEHLIADVDLDNDGLKEIIVTADLQVYIFEAVGLFGGDAVRFVYRFDLRDSDWGDRPNFKQYATKITAVAAGDDLDYDGRKELAIAAGPYLFIYNVNPDSFEDIMNNDFFVTSPVMEGRYYLVGNGDNSAFKYSQINAMTLCDTDKDGYREVIIGGIDDIRLMRQNGFVYIYECVGGTFQKAWTAPPEVTYWNPITVLLLDDQDYDGETEIIIGHSNGFDMWEHVKGADNTYQKVEYVTSNPNYPNIPYKTTLVGGETFYVGSRTLKSLTNLHGNYEGYVWMAYEGSTFNRAKFYNIATGTWTANTQFAWNYGASSIASESEPHINALANGDIYVTWNSVAVNSSTYIWVGYWDDSAATWSNPVAIPRGPLELGYRHSPSAFEFNSTHIGIAYVLDFFLGGQSVQVKVIKKDLTGSWLGLTPQYENRGDLSVHDAEMITLQDGSFALAMSATNLAINKLDYDIWVAWGNSSFNFEKQNAHQATTSFYDQMYVDIDYLRTEDHSLVVSYENIGAALEDRFGMVASQNRGSTWKLEQNLNTIPAYVTRIEQPGGYVWYNIGGVVLVQPMAYAPAFVARSDGGFMYAGSFSVIVPYKLETGWYRIPVIDMCFGINPQSDWALNNLHDVIDLAVGDTDSDGRREVAAAFENQVGVYEMKSSTNGTGFMSYLEAWLSDEFENPVTGITITDSNGNGWDDLSISSERGEVFFMEYPDVSEGAVPLRGSVQSWTATAAGYSNYAGFSSLLGWDIDQDGKDELIAAPFNNNTVQAFDDDGTSLWNNTDSASGYYRMVFADLDNDTMPEVLLGGRDQMIRVLDITDGTKLWNYTIGSGDVMALEAGDLDLDGEVEIVAGTEGGDVYIFHPNGTVFHSWSPGAGDVYQARLGNFTGVDHLNLALVTGDKITMINPLNGTVLYQSPTSTVAAGPNLRLADFNDDGLDDLVYGRLGVHVLDLNTKTVFYNSTQYSTGFYILDLWVYDFDGDGVLEIGSYNLQGSLFLEDINAGVTQWRYKANSIYGSIDVDVGNFGGSGKLDFVVGLYNSTDDGILLAIDGKNGIPMWFNETRTFPYGVGSADIHGSGEDTAFVWDLVSFVIKGYDSYERVVPLVPDAYSAHGLYWDKALSNTSLGGTQVADFNSDGLDEIVTWDKNATVYLLNGTNGAIIWKIPFAQTVTQVRIGDMDGVGWLDLVVRDANNDICVLSGTDGSQIGSIAHPTGFSVQDIYAEDFSGTYADDEIAVLWQSSTHVFIGWYNYDGSLHYKSSFNVTGQVAHMAVGRILGNPRPDVIIGGTNEAALIYRGSDGVFWWLYDLTPYSIYNIVVANLTGDDQADFILQDSSYKLHIINSNTQLQTYYVNSLSLIKQFGAADIDNDGIDEIVWSQERYGISGINYLGTLEWSFSAPLLTSTADWVMAFADMDADGYSDIVMSNHEYIDVISGKTTRLIWHYVSNDTNTRPQVGHFVGASAPLDILSYRLGRIYVVSGTHPAPMPPGTPVPMFRYADFGSIVALVAMVGLPLVALMLAPVGLVWYRRRKSEE